MFFNVRNKQNSKFIKNLRRYRVFPAISSTLYVGIFTPAYKLYLQVYENAFHSIISIIYRGTLYRDFSDKAVEVSDDTLGILLL